MCCGFIHDTLCFPLPLQHPMRDHIHYPSLKRHSYIFVRAFQEATAAFKHGPLFFVSPHPIDLITDDQYLKNFMIDDHTWQNFKRNYAAVFPSLQFATECLVECGVVRKTCAKLQLAEHFMMCYLRIFLELVPDIHKAHMNPEKNLQHPPRLSTLTLEQVRERIEKKPPIITITYSKNRGGIEEDPLYW